MRCSVLRPREIARRLPALETGDDREHGGIAQEAQDRKIIGRRMIEMIDLAAPLGPPDGEEIVQAEQLRRGHGLPGRLRGLRLSLAPPNSPCNAATSWNTASVPAIAGSGAVRR